MNKATTIILLILPLLLAPATAATALTATLDTTEPATIHGTANIHDATGLAATWDHEAPILLKAETLQLTTHRYEGETVTYPDGDDEALRVETNHEQETTTLEDATLTAIAWRTPLQLVAEPNPRTTITGESTQIATISAADDRTLAWEGHRNAPASSEDDHIYHQATIDTPTALLHGATNAHATGELDLFINNATLEARAQNGDTWSDWTGHRTQQTGSTHTYQIHITTLQATNATLTLHHPTTLALLGDALTLHTDATISLEQAQGILTLPDQDERTLHDDALTLHGAATTHATPNDARTLHLATTGELEILHTTNTNLEPHRALSNSESSLAWVILPIVLLTLLVAVPIKKPGLLKDLPDHKTEWLYNHWRDKGLEHEGQNRHEEAIKPYEKLVQLRPTDPFPWYLLSRSHLFTGNTETTLQTIRDAKENAEFIPGDIHEVHIIALWDDGREDEIPNVLDQIAQDEPDTALRIAQDLQLDHILANHDEAWWTNAQPARGQGIDGYA